ncbi:MAG TPA: hypothetical protein VF559_07630 [Caulobacteraceae bacterium]|jgi:hypothetical protein
MAKPALNILHSPSKNYALVGQQLTGIIKRHLPPGSYTETVGERRPKATNFSLFIARDPDVLMSHGAADKNYLYKKDEGGQRIINGMRHVLTPGPWLRERLLNSKSIKLSPSQIHSVGWPRLDDLLPLQQARPAEPRERPKVLWAPTHDYARRGVDELSTSSYPEFEQYLPRLREHFDVAVSLHPRNRSAKSPTVDQLIEADYVISDFGTMVYEAWALGKPVLFPTWIIGERIVEHLKTAAEAAIFRDRIGLHPNSIDEAIEMLRARPTLDSRTIAFRDEYLDPAYLGTSGRRVAELLLELSS